jgi:hypothetical protein
MSKVLEKIHAEIDHDPKASTIMAHVIRLERVVEKLSRKSLDAILEEPYPGAPAKKKEAPQEQQQQQQASEPAAAAPAS